MRLTVSKGEKGGLSAEASVSAVKRAFRKPISGCKCTRGELAASNIIPLQHLPSASSTHRGSIRAGKTTATSTTAATSSIAATAATATAVTSHLG